MEPRARANSEYGARDCPVCSSQEISMFLEVPQVPAYANVFWSTREEAVRAPKGDIRLGFCMVCGHIYNYSIGPGRMVYDQTYENSLHYSPRFQEYARMLALDLIERHSLHGRRIIEIGCGKGDFLTMLCELGGNSGIGFDPSYVPDRLPGSHAGRITFIQDYYSERYSDIPADFICCRQVLEHIPDPAGFIASLRKAIGDRQGIVVFFEVPNVRFTIEDLGIWDFIYEHCSYFSDSSLIHLFQRNGYAIGGIREAFGRQYLLLETSASDPVSTRPSVRVDDMGLPQHTVRTFTDRYAERVGYWARELQRYGESGKKVVLWGGGSKGVTFLNTVEGSDRIGYVVDVNPHKQGKFIGGTGQGIVSPLVLREYEPDAVIMMNPVYQEEIRAAVARMNLRTELIPV